MGAFEAYPLITPFLWFDGNAEEAAEFYVSVFPNSRVLDVVRATSAGPGPEGSVVTISFELDGLKFTGLNGGPHFPFTNAVSSWCGARRRSRWTIIGRSWVRVGRRSSVGG